jgi:hypothetical protein
MKGNLSYNGALQFKHLYIVASLRFLHEVKIVYKKGAQISFIQMRF